METWKLRNLAKHILTMDAALFQGDVNTSITRVPSHVTVEEIAPINSSVCMHDWLRVNIGRKCLTILAIKMKARAVGAGEKCLLYV